MTLPILMLQVTLWLLLGACLYLWSLRQGPQAAARCLSLVLGGVVLLSAVALLPMPGWPLHNTLTWFAPGDSLHAQQLPQATVRIENAPVEETGATAFSFKLSSLFPRQISRTTAAEPAPMTTAFSWGDSVVLTLLLACGCFGFVRLLLGLWAVRECRRRSVPVIDEGLHILCDTLRHEMSIAQHVELRTLAGLGSPATIGWRKPVLLLPENWTVWSEEERRSVFAHELAHVQAGDYARWLLAQLGTVLHGYQPLVHWLLARLHREQELAADLLAARHVGGTGIYLRSLCRLALAQQDGSQPFPARTLLPVRFPLIRRITMLRSWKNDERPSASRLRRWCGAALLLLLGVGVAGLRGTGWAQEKGEEKTGVFPIPREQAPGWAEQHKRALYASFDLKYVSPHAPGVLAVRPAAMCLEPAVKPLLAKANFALKWFLTELAGQDGDCLGLEQVEQVVSEVEVWQKTARMEGGTTLSLNTIRLVEGHGWRPFLATRFPQLEWKQHGNARYVLMSAEKMAHLPKALTLRPICLYMPDERTLVFPREAQLREWLAKGEPQLPAFVWHETWQQFEKDECLFAIGIDAQKVLKILAEIPSSPQLKPWGTLLGESYSVVFAGRILEKICFGVRATPKEGTDLQTYVQKAADAIRTVQADGEVIVVAPVPGAPQGFVSPSSEKRGPQVAPNQAIVPASGSVATSAARPDWSNYFPHGKRLPVRAYCSITIPPTEFLRQMLPPLDYDGKTQDQPAHTFQAQVKLVEVPVAVVEEFGRQQFGEKWAERQHGAVVLSAEQTRTLLEKTQGDKRTTVLCAPTVHALPGQTARIEIGRQEDGPAWECKFQMSDALEGKGIVLDLHHKYNNDGKGLRPVTPQPVEKPKHKRALAWSSGAREAIPPGHSMLLLATDSKEIPQPNETTFLLLATPSREPLQK